MLTQVGRSIFLGDTSLGVGSQHPLNFLPPMYAQTVSPRATKFGVITQVGHECVYTALATSHPKRVGPQHLQMFGTSFVHVHRMTNNNQILHCYHSRCEDNFDMTTNADS